MDSDKCKKAHEAFTAPQPRYEEHRRVWWEYIFGLEEEVKELTQKLESLKKAQEYHKALKDIADIIDQLYPGRNTPTG